MQVFPGWKRSAALPGLAFIVLVLAAACGGGDESTGSSVDDEPTPESGASPAATDTAEPTPTPAAEATDTPAATPTPEPTPTQEQESNTLSESECTDASGIDDLDYRSTAAASGNSVTLEAGDNFFDATCVTVSPGTTVEVIVENVGQALHNIQAEDQDVDMDVNPGDTITVEFEVGDEPLQFTCKYHETLGMAGAIVPAEDS